MLILFCSAFLPLIAILDFTEYLLSRAVGMPCVLVNGINKSSAYQPGRPIDRSALRAQWNAVYVDGQWRLIDVFWASTCIVGRVSPDWKLLSVDGIPKDFPDCIEVMYSISLAGCFVWH